MQIIARRLNRPNPEKSTARETRAAWSERERDNVIQLAEQRLKRVTRLRKNDWRDITEEHNKRFAGQMLKTGERLVIPLATLGKPAERAQKEFVTKDCVFTKRSLNGITSMVKRWPETKHLIRRSGVGGEENVKMELSVSDEEDIGDIDLEYLSGGDGSPGTEPGPKPEYDEDEDEGGMGGQGANVGLNFALTA
jgi:hypothetical protein